jgi:hypothetical protein
MMPTPPLYFIECDFRSSRAFVETARDSNSRSQVISDIISGQHDKFVRILEIVEDEGTCRDVTEDLAREIATKHLDDTPSYELLTFLEQHLGCGFMADVVREIAA